MSRKRKKKKKKKKRLEKRARNGCRLSKGGRMYFRKWVSQLNRGTLHGRQGGGVGGVRVSGKGGNRFLKGLMGTP